MNTRIQKTVRNLSLSILLGATAVVPVTAQVVSSQASLGLPASPTATQGSPRQTSSPNGRVFIGPGDLLNVTVFEVPEMTQTIRVNDVGDATLSLIGSMHLAGLTTFDAQAAIASNLKARNYLVDPQVSVFIGEYSTQGVSILGEVHKPGVYPVLGARTLLDIVSEAGGITAFAGAEAMIKHVDGSTVRIKLTKDAQASFLTDVQLAPGDKILIPRAGVVYVLGDVGRPGGFIMGNDGKITLLQAIAMAGGSNRTSELNHSQLFRKGDSGKPGEHVKVKQILEGKLADIELQSEDILYIPSSSAKSLVYRTAPSIAASAAGAAIYAGAL